MTKQLNDTTNSLGLLLNDRALYEHLDSTMQNASNLLRDIKEHPKRYVHFSVF
jgi:phospholipid/cholesterol/gamma-HCH transport system substrate-binding protein